MTTSKLERTSESRGERMTLARYVDLYLTQIADGTRQTDKGTNYSPNTVRAVKQAMTQWKEFQKYKRRIYENSTAQYIFESRPESRNRAKIARNPAETGLAVENRVEIAEKRSETGL